MKPNKKYLHRAQSAYDRIVSENSALAQMITQMLISVTTETGIAPPAPDTSAQDKAKEEQYNTLCAKYITNVLLAYHIARRNHPLRQSHIKRGLKKLPETAAEYVTISVLRDEYLPLSGRMSLHTELARHGITWLDSSYHRYLSMMLQSYPTRAPQMEYNYAQTFGCSPETAKVELQALMRNISNAYQKRDAMMRHKLEQQISRGRRQK